MSAEEVIEETTEETETALVPDQDDQTPNDGKIDEMAYHRAIKEAATSKKLLRETQQRLKAMEDQMQDVKRKALTEKEDFKTLYEQEKEAHTSTQEEKNLLKQSVIRAERLRTLYPILKRMGLVDSGEKYLERESLEEIEVEVTSNGRILVTGAEEFAQQWRQENEILFKDRKAPVVNSGGGHYDGSVKNLTPAMLIQIEKKHGVRSQEYQKAHKQYLEQKRGK